MPGELYESDGHHANFFVKSPFYCHRNYGKRYLVRPVIIFSVDIVTGTIAGNRTCLIEYKKTLQIYSNLKKSSNFSPACKRILFKVP